MVLEVVARHGQGPLRRLLQSRPGKGCANTRNGIGKDTDQYAAMSRLTSKMSLGEQPFDIAGYSKGGGIAQEAGLLNPDAQVRIFNSAGLPDNALQWTGSRTSTVWFRAPRRSARKATS